MDGYTFDIAGLLERQKSAGRAYLEFIRERALSVGLYVLPAGGEDPQQPHTEDEVYFVVGGRAAIKVADRDTPVEAGSIVYVGAGVEHRFHTITEDLSVLVFFAPAEYTAAGKQGKVGGQQAE